MWVVTFMDHRARRARRVIVQHEDGSDPISICQALRLFREQLIRWGTENNGRIIKCELEADLELIRAKEKAE